MNIFTRNIVYLQPLLKFGNGIIVLHTTLDFLCDCLSVLGLNLAHWPLGNLNEILDMQFSNGF